MRYIYSCKDYGTSVALLSIIINGFYYLSLTLSLMNIANCREKNEYYIKENSAHKYVHYVIRISQDAN